jgi:hypothetical protein
MKKQRASALLLVLVYLSTAAGLSPGLLPRSFPASLRAPPVVAGVRRKIKRRTEVETSKGFDPRPQETAAVDAPRPPITAPASEQRVEVEAIDVFALPDDAASLLELRVPASLARPDGYVELFSSVADAASSALGDEAALTAFVAANRDLLDYRFQYRLTAQGIAATNLGDETGAAQRNKLRDAIVKACLRFDGVFYREVGLAEQRLGQLLGAIQSGDKPGPEAMVAAAGGAPQQRLGFWFVTSAAISAWESKLEVPSVAGQARQKLVELGSVRDALEADSSFLVSAGVDVLAPLVRAQLTHPLDHVRYAPQATAAINAMPAMDEEARTRLLRKIGCLREQCSRHAYQVRCRRDIDYHRAITARDTHTEPRVLDAHVRIELSRGDKGAGGVGVACASSALAMRIRCAIGEKQTPK